ncbi:MAG: Holliday junction branch migration protein RuvA [Gammaproteobacteria bacterium]|jgi:holliday junction DNA helicase RuvA
MIGRLRGELVSKDPPFLLLEVNGVGYDVESPMSTFYNLPATGQQVLLYTHLAIRDDAHVLYGFASESERSLFRALLKVSGVGAKMALVILSGMSTDEFALCIQSGDSASLVRLPGIGKKSAERLIVEMRDRLDRLDLGQGVVPSGDRFQETARSPVSDAVGALIALGYKPNDASRMVRAQECEGLTSEEIIRAALKASVTP